MRADKRAQFEQPKSRTGLHLALAGVALVAVIAVALVELMNRGAEGAPVAAAPVAAGGADVTIPVADSRRPGALLQLRRRRRRGEVLRHAEQGRRVPRRLRRCDVCYPNKKGYAQQGDLMVCNNCGQQFDSNQINELKGGCNPSPIERTVKGKTLVLKTSDITGRRPVLPVIRPQAFCSPAPSSLSRTR